MKLRPIKGKKSGIVGSAISNFWSYVIFVFVVIIFFVFFQIQVNDTKVAKITSLEEDINMDMSVINYLRTPIGFEIDGGGILIAQDKTLADFLVEKIGLVYLIGSGDTAQIQNEIDEVVKENIDDFKKQSRRRLMVLIKEDINDIGGCLYDSREITCDRSQDPTFKVPEGIAILPLPISSGQNQFLEVVVR